ncbi:MAG: tetratricopeptide repeat protein [Candidatus Hydrogenedentota bacterium]|nr:MAG: tetratricopeptide repeat protein [Candidatus Hydrogenedentota bacterium]
MSEQTDIATYPKEEAIVREIKTGNFQQVEKLAEEWIQQLPIEKENSEEKKLAEEAFYYARFFLNRSERLSMIHRGRERANLFREYLRQLRELREENNFIPHSPFWQAMKLYIYQNIAESLSSVFSGQQAYNLDTEEQLIFAESLIEIGSLKQALDALAFFIKMHPRNARARLLYAYVYFLLGNEKEFLKQFREALFLNPDVLDKNTHRIPEGTLRKLYDFVCEQTENPRVRYRSYALLLEVQKIYSDHRILSKNEALKVQTEFFRLYDEYKKQPEREDELLPRLLHFLIWLILYFRGTKNFDKAEEFRLRMVDLDMHTWETFYKNHLE